MESEETVWFQLLQFFPLNGKMSVISSALLCENTSYPHKGLPELQAGFAEVFESEGRLYPMGSLLSLHCRSFCQQSTAVNYSDLGSRALEILLNIPGGVVIRMWV